jgi:hypothetical protein
MNFDPNQIAQTFDRLHQARFAADRNLLCRQGTGRCQELDGARSRGLPVLAGSGNRSVCHLLEDGKSPTIKESLAAMASRN